MSSRPKNNLVALSSAAIIAVYAAGFVRTRAAAAKIAEREERKPPMRATTPRPPREVALAPAPVAVATPKVPKKPKATSKLPRQAPPEAAPTPTSIEEQTPAPAAVAPAPTSSPVQDTTKQADSARVVWHDGYYFGWGTSRHGDIQAAVEIKDGRIVAATITQCLTRYSCSWIDHLPGQVVSRQSPEVDFVSGATQSTNAFYYAVVEALKQAR